MRDPGLQRSGAWKSTKNLTWVRLTSSRGGRKDAWLRVEKTALGDKY